MSSAALSTHGALELEDIGFSYTARVNGGDGALFKDFSLRIEQGSIVTIMGASGAGKSTLGRIMAGIVIPQKGVVRRSPDLTQPSDLVYVDQHPMNGVFPWQTVLENVRYPLQKLGLLVVPVSALDGKVTAEITTALHELALQDRKTLVLITHNESDALAL